MYTGDHLALLDHLRIDRCHLFGQCIGGSFILSLLKAQPGRVASAVLAQPIGRVGALPAGRSARFEMWVESLKDHPEATEWKTGAALTSARARVKEFLGKHTPGA